MAIITVASVAKRLRSQTLTSENLCGSQIAKKITVFEINAF